MKYITTLIMVCLIFFSGCAGIKDFAGEEVDCLQYLEIKYDEKGHYIVNYKEASTCRGKRFCFINGSWQEPTLDAKYCEAWGGIMDRWQRQNEYNLRELMNPESQGQQCPDGRYMSIDENFYCYNTTTKKWQRSRFTSWEDE